MNKNIIIYVSSRNNYDMLEGEVLKNIDFDGFEFINVDDGSCEEEVENGKRICQKNDIIFLHNKSTGVQFATQTLIDFINENRKECKWIVCFQHDNHPLTNNFFGEIDNLIGDNKLNSFGAIGFNNIDTGKRYTKDHYEKWKMGERPLGMIGINVFGSGPDRFICSGKDKVAINNYQAWKLPFIIEFPMWASVGINIDKWNGFVKPTTDYEFHLWFIDIMMQLNINNSPCIVMPDLYCMNDQSSKRKYNIPANSAKYARKGDFYHFGSYGPHLKNFKKRWGWDYEKGRESLEKVIVRYKDTLIEQFYNNDISKTKKPLKIYNFNY
jgi:hypothetical protein